MRITPMDIRQQQFTVRMFRGFDVQEVDTFLEDVAQDYEAMIKENALLKEQLQALEERTRGLEDREKILQQTLVTTQRMTEEMKETARREAALILRRRSSKATSCSRPCAPRSRRSATRSACSSASGARWRRGCAPPWRCTSA